MRKKAAILSAFIWGSGQFFIGRERARGIIFFLTQIAVTAVEFFTGYWPEWLMGQIDEFQIRLYGGFFTKGIWGLITLGSNPGKDHSMILLIRGLLIIFVLVIIGGIWCWNIIDAWKSAEKRKNSVLISENGFRRKYAKLFPYLVLSPITVIFLAVIVLPIICCVLTAFTNYNRDHLPPGNLLSWVGFENFRKLFTIPIWSDTFLRVATWTVVWAVTVTVLTYFIGMFQAMILNSQYVRGRKIFKTILILPWAIPQMISLMVFRNLFNGQFGPINQILLDMGIISKKIPFLTDPLNARITVIIVAVWLGAPMFMVMMLGTFSNMDQSLYEAASLDGAGKIQIFRYITFPLVFLATAPLLVMNLAGNFNGFGLIYFMTKGGPTNSELQFAGDTDILISWIYKLTLDQRMYNMAAVMSILIFILIGAVSLWNFKRTASFKEI